MNKIVHIGASGSMTISPKYNNLLLDLKTFQISRTTKKIYVRSTIDSPSLCTIKSKQENIIISYMDGYDE